MHLETREQGQNFAAGIPGGAISPSDEAGDSVGDTTDPTANSI